MHFAICKTVWFGSKARFQGKIFHQADQIAPNVSKTLESQTVKIFLFGLLFIRYSGFYGYYLP